MPDVETPNGATAPKAHAGATAGTLKTRDSWLKRIIDDAKVPEGGLVRRGLGRRGCGSPPASHPHVRQMRRRGRGGPVRPHHPAAAPDTRFVPAQ